MGTQTAEKIEPVPVVDLTGQVCPMTFYRVRHHLGRMRAGELVEFVLKGTEQIQTLPACIRQDGHKIEQVRREGDLLYLLVNRVD